MDKSKDEKFLRGVAFRLSQICFFFSIAFTVYSFSSLEFIQKFDPSVTLLDNTIPRILFNAIPFIALGLVCRSKTISARLLGWLSIFGIPVLFVAACMIYVWPLIYKGHTELYFYVHAANIFIMAATIIAASAPPFYTLIQALAFATLFGIPVSVMLIKHDMLLFKTFINDFLIMASVSSLTSYSIYKLRVKLMEADQKIQSEVSSFLGKPLARAIYSSSLEPYESKTHSGVILVIDIRGYTNLKKTLNKDQFRQFMRTYHRMIASVVGASDGHLMKSMGDGHLIFFGDFESPDLSGIPGLEAEDHLANTRMLADSNQKAYDCAQKIIREFDLVLKTFDIVGQIKLGAALDCGEIETMIIGDDNHRREFDMSGDVIIRCTRLESYTKLLMAKYGLDASYLVISPYCHENLKTISNLERHETIEQDRKVRDFPEIEHLYFYRFDHGAESVRKLKVAA